MHFSRLSSPVAIISLLLTFVTSSPLQYSQTPLTSELDFNPSDDIRNNLRCYPPDELDPFKFYTQGFDNSDWLPALRTDCYAAAIWIKHTFLDPKEPVEQCWNPDGVEVVYVKTVGTCTIAVEDLQDRGPNPACVNISKELFLAASAISRKCSQKDDDGVWVTAAGETTFFVPGEEGDLVGLGFTVYVGRDPELEEERRVSKVVRL